MNPLSGYLVWIKLGFVAILAAFLAFFAYKVRSWHQDALELGSVRRQMVELKASQAASHAASRGLQNEIEKLRGDRKPAPVVRVCKPAKPLPPAGTGHHGATPGAGELPQENGRDIGPDLYGLADDADEIAARLRACQALLK